MTEADDPVADVRDGYAFDAPSLNLGAFALSLAARAYVGDVVDDWTDRQAETCGTAEHLATRVRAHPL
jgi:hypothetical protein